MSQTMTSKIPQLIPTPDEATPYYFEIESDTSPDLKYQIRYQLKARRWACNCHGYKFAHDCKHLAAVKQVLEQRRAAKAALMEEQQDHEPTIAEVSQHLASLSEAVDRNKYSISALDEKLEAELAILREEIADWVKVFGRKMEEREDEHDDLEARVSKLEITEKPRPIRTSKSAVPETAPLNGSREFKLMR